ncbi:hypothetical protein PHLGIDRAFT_266160 [Phlebiopsis gigantea 11061_1 CR5-6]|uniref:Nickel/cobalt efflux system n=1 Tax=Phlebiopsis gigantea (strain 11061_1 CR5-6) TaxID=745531 RepID=A0A0C3PS90_PHLG1|nr:hypothetical protein PHLGIDRAFT_266160 [Phlebiopsis gigantea 11061_1 CR5-6]
MYRFPRKFSDVYRPRMRLTLLGRSVLLLGSELAVNVVCWVVAGVLFGRSQGTRPVLSLALLAWTIGLRHALDADHISAIDNATRSLLGMGQLPVTCGLFFSLGHSTIVIAVNIAIAISTSVYDHINGVGNIGGIVGTAVSASFLFIVGLANSIILWRVLVKRRRMKRERQIRLARGEDLASIERDFELRDMENHGNTLMMKIIGPIVTFVDRPWKMYPVGVLFGFGFDTASSIALLAVSAIAKKDSNGNQIPAGYIVILPFLFTAGMTLIDSADSILMLYAYAGFPEHRFALLEDVSAPGAQQLMDPEAPATPGTKTPPVLTSVGPAGTPDMSTRKTPSPSASLQELPQSRVRSPAPSVGGVSLKAATEGEDGDGEGNEERLRQIRIKRNAMSGLSIMLTLMSILVAFTISLIEIMGLIGDNCKACQDAANDPDGGGLAGRWWRGWAAANDQSGYIGAAIVGCFVAIVAVWYGGSDGSCWRVRLKSEIINIESVHYGCIITV